MGEVFTEAKEVLSKLEGRFVFREVFSVAVTDNYVGGVPTKRRFSRRRFPPPTPDLAASFNWRCIAGARFTGPFFFTVYQSERALLRPPNRRTTEG